MASRQQIDRLSQRIEAFAAHVAPVDDPRPELWLVECDRAYQPSNPEEVITIAELEARPPTRTAFPGRIIVRFVHAKNGGPAECCQPGGACYALHGPI